MTTKTRIKVTYEKNSYGGVDDRYWPQYWDIHAGWWMPLELESTGRNFSIILEEAKYCIDEFLKEEFLRRGTHYIEYPPVPPPTTEDLL